MDDVRSNLLGSSARPRLAFAGSVAEAKKVPVSREPWWRGKKIAIAVPSGRSWEARSATSITACAALSAMAGLQIGVLNLEGSMVSKQRNDLVHVARESGHDYVMWFDSDMTFPPNALMRLLQHNKDIVGATYCKRVPPYETLGRLRGKKATNDDIAAGGLWRAEMLPGGMMLIKMSVYEKLGWPYYHEAYQWPGANGLEAWKEMMRHNYSGIPPEDAMDEIKDTKFAKWLQTVWEVETYSTPKNKETGEHNRWDYTSEDLAFCRKAQKAGFELWCDLDLTFETGHVGIQTVTCNRPNAEPAASGTSPSTDVAGKLAIPA